MQNNTAADAMKRLPRPVLATVAGLLVWTAGAMTMPAGQPRHLSDVERTERVSPAFVPTDARQAQTLQGDAARAQLKADGHYASLDAAITATRYGIREQADTPSTSDDALLWSHNPAHGIRAGYSPAGLTLHIEHRTAGGGAAQTYRSGLRLERIGYGDAQRPIGPGELSRDGQRVTIARPEIEEWFINRPSGLEQGFTVWERPVAAESEDSTLDLVLAFDGELEGRSSEDGQRVALLNDTGDTVLHYDGLKAWDATGRSVAGSMHSRGKALVFSMHDADATYPLTIDPTFSQVAYLKASNPGEVDEFGNAIALSGDTVVVGAGLEDSNSTGVNGNQSDNSASGSGAVYVFRRDGATWTQEAYLKGSNTEGGDQFGRSVALSGDTLVVGAFNEDSSASGINGDQSDNSAFDSGAAYVFRRDGATWTQEAYLKAFNPDAGDLFGMPVALSGDRVVVGATHEDGSAMGINGDPSDNSAFNSGAAYVFRRDGATWTQEAYLKGSNTESGDFFGGSVAVSGDTVAVGSVREASGSTGVNSIQSDNSAPFAGAAYVFHRNGNTWMQEAYLKASTTDSNDRFGSAIALSGDTLVVGAIGERSNGSGESDNSAPFAGAAYVFHRDGSNWTQEAYLKASNTDNNDQFGHTAAISGDTVVVGAFKENSSASGINGDQSDNSAVSSGAAYVFRRNGSAWTQETYLKASNTDPSDAFGRSVALSGDTLAVGAPGEASSASGINGDQSDNSADSAGAAYVFDLVSATPVALDDTGSTLENTDLMVAAPGVLDNDTGDDLMAVLELGSSDGLVVLNADGSYTYQPDAGFSGTDSFTYRASDGVETSEVATVTITVVADFDGDGIPDATDPDDDNDGVDDANDAFPTDPTRGVSCEPGFFGAFFCAEAEPGFFVASSGALTATPCPAGSFSAFSGSAICTDASPGFFVSEPAQSEQLECAAGSFSAFSASTACTQASPGSFVPLPGAQSQQSCRVGFFSATTGAAACEPAPIGTYIDQDGATEAQACPAGTTTLAEGSVSVGACVQIESEKPVTLYQHVHFNGNTLAIGEGEVTIQDLRESVGNDTISSIEIAPGYTVIACQHSGFKGRCEVFNTSASDLRMVRFNDTISSLRIKKASLQPVTVYKHINYSGAALTVGEGDVTIQDLRNSVGNDTISSIEIAPGYTVTACQHSGFRGRCTVFKSAVSDLRRIRFNDVISSLRVRKIPVPAVTVYQHVNFRGNALAVGEGRVTIRDLRRSAVGNDVVSSIEIEPGYEVTACQHQRLRGRCEVFTESVTDLRGIGFNDVISSLRIRSAP